jgi:hypothetical protein
MAFNKQLLTDALISHELAHLIIELENDYLAIKGDVLQRGSPDRRMVGTFLSLFEHPDVYRLQREHGVDLSDYVEKNMSEYGAEIDRLAPEPAPPMFFLNITTGYAELHHLCPDDSRWNQH